MEKRSARAEKVHHLHRQNSADLSFSCRSFIHHLHAQDTFLGRAYEKWILITTRILPVKLMDFICYSILFVNTTTARRAGYVGLRRIWKKRWNIETDGHPACERPEWGIRVACLTFINVTLIGGPSSICQRHEILMINRVSYSRGPEVVPVHRHFWDIFYCVNKSKAKCYWLKLIV